MKILICQVSIITLLLTACSKQEETSAPSVVQKPAPAAAAPAAETPKAAIETTTSQAKGAAESVANEAAKTADTLKNAEPTTPAAESTGFKAWTDKVKTLISQKKYTEALAAFSELPANLTPDQQKLVDQLKAQVQQALSSQTADQGLKAVGGLLNNTKK